MKTVPVRVVEFAEWKPVRDQVIDMLLPVAFMTFNESNKQPGGYYANGHLLHYYKVDGVDYNEVFKNMKL